MDLTSKGISWVGNMYQKLETICVDKCQEMNSIVAQGATKYVETQVQAVGNIYQKLETICVDTCQEMNSIISQEPTKHVESQVQAVGENVRKFCTEVMQDFLSPSSFDSTKGPVSDLSLTCHIDDGMCKTSTIGIKDCHRSEKVDPPAKVEVLSAVEDPSQGTFPAGPCAENDGEECDTLTKKSISVSVEIAASKWTTKAQENCRDMSDEIAFIDLSVSHFSDTDVFIPVLCHESSSILSSSALSTDDNGPVVPGRSDDSSQNDISEANDSNNISEIIEEFDDVILGESYIDAENREFNSELAIVSQRASRSYKEKFRDALVSKLRLRKKHAYGNFRNLYTNVENTNHEGTLVESNHSNRPQSQEFCESEWEFL